MFLDNLPLELKIQIFNNLLVADLRNIALVSKKQHQVINNEQLWKTKLFQDFGFVKKPGDQSYKRYYNSVLVFLRSIDQDIRDPSGKYDYVVIRNISLKFDITPQFMYLVAKIILRALSNNVRFTLIDFRDNIESLHQIYNEDAQMEKKHQDCGLRCIPELAQQMVNFLVNELEFFIHRIENIYELRYLFEFFQQNGFSQQKEKLFSKILNDENYINRIFQSINDVTNFENALRDGNFVSEKYLFLVKKDEILKKITYQDSLVCVV